MSDSAVRPAPELLATIRAGLIAAGFTSDGVLARLGATAFAALAAGVTLPARRALVPPADLLSVLIATFLIGDSVPVRTWESVAGGTELLTSLQEAGLLRSSADQVVATLAVHPFAVTVPPELAGPDSFDAASCDAASCDVDCRDPEHRGPALPSADWYLVSDIGNPVSPDHVLGPGGAAVTLAQITPRPLVARALDLGCGGGVQALRACVHSGVVVATDTNPRALAMTAMSAGLSGVPADRLELCAGSLFEPVAGQRFDLIVSNPPFVISPSHRFTYRDAGLPGDELSRQVVRGAATHLAPGGVAAILVNWLLIEGEDWRDRVSGWVTEPDVSVWVAVREVTSVLDYALVWLRDIGLDADRSADSQFDDALGLWLDSFADQGARAVGFGWVMLLREPPDAPSWVAIDDLSAAGRLPNAEEVAQFLTGWSAVSKLTVPELLALPLRVVPGVVVNTEQLCTSDGDWRTGPSLLGQPDQMGDGGWRAPVEVAAPVFTALLTQPDRGIGERLDEVAAEMGLDAVELLAAALISIRELLALGLVES